MQFSFRYYPNPDVARRHAAAVEGHNLVLNGGHGPLVLSARWLARRCLPGRGGLPVPRRRAAIKVFGYTRCYGCWFACPGAHIWHSPGARPVRPRAWSGACPQTGL